MEQKNRISFGQEGRDKLIAGIDKLANTVKITLGATGQNVILDRGYDVPHITKDGVTVAKEINLEDEIENMGTKLIREASIKTCEDAGDGTTTSTVLAQAIIHVVYDLLKVHKYTPIDIKRSLDRVSQRVVQVIKELAIPVDINDVETIKNIATISANNDKELGTLIANAFSKVGKDGLITVEPSKDFETRIEVLDGLRFNNGFETPYFVTNPDKMICELENPYILFVDKEISFMSEIVGICESILREQRPLLIVSNGVKGEALSTLIGNKMSGRIHVATVKGPSYGVTRTDMLEDLAILTGGTLIDESKGLTLDRTSIGHLGQCEKVILTKNDTTIIGSKGEKNIIDQRISSVKTLMKDVDNEFDKEKYQERLANLVGGVGVIFVGAGSEVEMKEKRDRVDDALCATHAAIEEGYVPGGGLTYLLARGDLITKGDYPQEIGLHVLDPVLKVPFEQMCRNSGIDDPESIHDQLDLINKPQVGYDFKKCRVTNLVENGIIDPAKVTRVAFENAVSIACMILLNGAVVHDVKSPVIEEKK